MNWTEITQDNVEDVYNINKDRMVLARECFGRIQYRMMHDWSPTISTMAKTGGYYYIELPELKVNEL